LIGSVAIFSLLVQALSFVEYERPASLFRNGHKVQLTEDHVVHLKTGGTVRSYSKKRRKSFVIGASHKNAGTPRGETPRASLMPEKSGCNPHTTSFSKRAPGLNTFSLDTKASDLDSIQLKGLRERVGETIRLETVSGIVRFKNIALKPERSMLRRQMKLVCCNFAVCCRWWANFWLERTDNMIGGTVLLCLFILSFLPLQHVQSVVLFNRNFGEIISSKTRRSEFVKNLLS
jgi:hypothetical protein